jgi:hypothetical protein
MSTTTPDLAPTIADVAALIRARTKDSNGNELGTFTADTRPTDVQAQEAIDHAVVLVHLKVGAIGDGCASVAKMCATYGAAAEIELSYFPEQARADRSPYTFLIARWEEILIGVEQCVLGNLPDDPSEDGGGVPGGLRFGTVDAISGTVHAHYTGQLWPPLPIPDEPVVQPVRDADERT